MVGIRSPDGLVVGSCTSHPGVLGSIPKREEPGKTGAPCVKVPGSSRVPPLSATSAELGLGLGLGLGLDSLHTPSRTRSPSSRHPPFTHLPFPPRSLVCCGQPSPHKPRLVVSHSTCPPLSSSPHAHSFVLGTVVINTHTFLPASRDGGGALARFVEGISPE
jgi:hypothetical protein